MIRERTRNFREFNDCTTYPLLRVRLEDKTIELALPILPNWRRRYKIRKSYRAPLERQATVLDKQFRPRTRTRFAPGLPEVLSALDLPRGRADEVTSVAKAANAANTSGSLTIKRSRRRLPSDSLANGL